MRYARPEEAEPDEAEPEDEAPEDEIPVEFRAPEPTTGLTWRPNSGRWSWRPTAPETEPGTTAEPVIAACGVTRKDLIRDSFADVMIAVYGPIRLVIDVFTDHPLRAAFWAVVLCIAGLSIYLRGWRRAYRVEVTRTTLRWRAPFRRVEVPLLSVRSASPRWSRNRKLVVDGRRGTRTAELSLRRLPDVDPFLATLLTAAPGIVTAAPRIKAHVSPLSARTRL